MADEVLVSNMGNVYVRERLLCCTYVTLLFASYVTSMYASPSSQCMSLSASLSLSPSVVSARPRAGLGCILNNGHVVVQSRSFIAEPSTIHYLARLDSVV